MEEDEMKKKKSRTLPVKTIPIKSGKGHCSVSQPFVVVQQSQGVKFQNGSKGKVHVHVSDDGLFSEPVFSLDKGKDKTQVVRSVPRGIYPYAVYCEENDGFCTGSSMPIIIVPTERET
jgi:hypothetical protein